MKVKILSLLEKMNLTDLGFQNYEIFLFIFPHQGGDSKVPLACGDLVPVESGSMVANITFNVANLKGSTENQRRKNVEDMLMRAFDLPEAER